MKTPSDRQKLMAEIETMRIPLPINPDKIGLASLFELSSVFYSYRERVSSILRDAVDDLNEVQKSQILAKETLRVESNKLLTREEIKILKPIAVQQAACEVFLTPHNKAVMDCELNLSDTKTFLMKVQVAHEDIKDKIRTIRLQADISAQINGYAPMRDNHDPSNNRKGAELQ